MKDLKQIFVESCKNNPVLGADCFEEKIKPAVSAWLMQHLKESPCKKCFYREDCQRPQEHALEAGFYGCVDTDEVKKYNQAIHEMLEELSKL